MKILIIGAKGNLGSQLVKVFSDFEVIAWDKESLDVTDKDQVREKISNLKPDVIINTASFNAVDKCEEPTGFEMAQKINGEAVGFLADAALAVNAILVHYSTDYVFSGDEQGGYIETDMPAPISKYGESKLMVERILEWYRKIKGLNFVILRYFNACGASLDGKMGESHNPESHIIPNVLSSIKSKKTFLLFGNDYKTPDGTCVRDYIHVLDLVDAHVLALSKLDKTDGGFVYNVGTGNGFSNQQIIDKAKEVTGMDLDVKVVERRPGDADILVADVSKIKAELGFMPKYSDLTTIIKSAWDWENTK